jgi:DNA recombination protein RmuC
MQATTAQMETLLKATQTTLAQAQEETRALRRALTAPTIQGQWGEMHLQRIVELAGMSPYCVEIQATVSGVNGVQRPDLLVKLSNGRTIVVDVKAPYDSYIQIHGSSHGIRNE